MSYSAIRPYFRDSFVAAGFNEWQDGFSFDNIPETLLDRSFHVFIESISGGPINQADQDSSATVIANVFFRGYRDVTIAIDESIVGLEAIVKQVCKAQNRVSAVRNVVFDGADFAPISIVNDSSVLLTLRFTATLSVGVEE